jgi:hypothetical protein
VVVASRPDDGDPAVCLEALGPQRDETIEVLVASAEGAARPDVPWVSWIGAPAEASVPHLWGMGLARARGDLVAFTTAQFRPAPDWLAVVRDAHVRHAAAGIGGPVDPPATSRPFDWAVFFLRYSAYLLDAEAPIGDLAGDNASYKRAALDGIAPDAGGEFWEQEAHRGLRSRGHGLVFVPAMRVRQVGSLPAGAFLAQRVRHGRRFGWERALRHGRPWRLLALAGSPLVPAILLAKVVSRSVQSGRYRGRLLLALPALALSSAAWGLGEARGYLGSVAHR